jgi:hypothetical protein
MNVMTPIVKPKDNSVSDHLNSGGPLNRPYRRGLNASNEAHTYLSYISGLPK